MGQCLTWDVDQAGADVRFTNGDFVPLSLSNILSTGPVVRLDNAFYGSLRFRHLSPRPLVEDGSIFSIRSNWRTWSLAGGEAIGNWPRDVFNVLNSKDFVETFAEDGLFVRPLDPIQAPFTLTRYY